MLEADTTHHSTHLSGLTLEQCQSARLARDNRFDGRFFVAVKTTGIFCRPICPANLPKEANVEYFAKQVQALQSGYRPCLRCRPDSAPGSWAWKGVETTFQRAVNLIDQGELQSSNLPELSSRLGISDRYLRQLFQQYLGMSPKQYAQYQQLMFAKQLLHTSNMSIGDIAIASGFNSVRRFNDAFQKKLKLTPSDTRKTTRADTNAADATVDKHLRLSYRPPFNWDHLLAFYRKRAIQSIEEVGEDYYARTFVSTHSQGWFKAELGAKNTLEITFDIDDITQLKHMVSQIRRLFDLDADIAVIEQHLQQTAIGPLMTSGLRIPGVWSAWEAGVRAIFGQQVSITAAITVLNGFVSSLDETEESGVASRRYFPTPTEIVNADFSVLRMPQTRKDTLKRFADYMVDHMDAPPEDWLALKGIGPWTVSYAKLRGLSQPDCFLSTDLVIKKAIADVDDQKQLIESLSPWGSYATFNCWNSQS
ncbi:DNA-3-methyladenine glycosylase 2 family protein [Leucothrix arctica]|uniref:3-methyladenine DNA glycosylase n=1 Tax=Leucothrix arctica TaxID=1481894 RepID=A0A317C479_9GAMM|nr:AlkA N-terminal domain-containing protein [Leucothrix arctica]PWQ93414.1 3-methyladenine DNA glycosylase [Leucothrix arctica]